MVCVCLHIHKHVGRVRVPFVLMQRSPFNEPPPRRHPRAPDATAEKLQKSSPLCLGFVRAQLPVAKIYGHAGKSGAAFIIFHRLIQRQSSRRIRTICALLLRRNDEISTEMIFIIFLLRDHGWMANFDQLL